MKYPVISGQNGNDWTEPDAIVRFAQATEEAGVDALAFTEHPAPSLKWLESGGHETFDPLVALGFCAAASTHLRLVTLLTVAPYRNPLLLAKSMATLDVLSRGRTTFALGVGYLRSEFAALGVEFDDRNSLFDEAVDVLRRVFDEEPFTHRGRTFNAVGQAIRPRPVQRPHPPLWFGGNAAIVRDRVARCGQGWAPMVAQPERAGTTRTAAISTDAELAAAVLQIKEAMSARGREPEELDVLAKSSTPLPPSASAKAHLDSLERLARLGTTWTYVPIDTSSIAAGLESLSWYGRTVIANLRA